MGNNLSIYFSSCNCNDCCNSYCKNIWQSVTHDIYCIFVLAFIAFIIYLIIKYIVNPNIKNDHELKMKKKAFEQEKEWYGLKNNNNNNNNNNINTN